MSHKSALRDREVSLDLVKRRFYAVETLRRVSIGAYLAVNVLYMQQQGLSLGTIGAVVAWFTVLVLLLELPMGALADLIGRRRTLMAASLLSGLGYLIFVLGDSVVAFGLAISALALGTTMTTGAGEAWLVEGVKHLNRGSDVYAVLAKAATFGSTIQGIGAILACGLPWILSGLMSSDVALAIPLLVSVVAEALRTVVVFRFPNEETKRGVGRGQIRYAGLAGIATGIQRIVLRLKNTIRERPSLGALLAIKFCLGFSLYGASVGAQPRLATFVPDINSMVWFFGLAFGLGSIAGGAGAFVSVRLITRLPLDVRVTCAALRALEAIALISFGFASHIAFTVAAYCAFYFFDGLLEPVQSTMVQERVGDGVRASMESMQSVAVQLGGAAALLGIGRLTEGGIWVAYATPLLITCLLYLFVSRRRVSDLGASMS